MPLIVSVMKQKKEKQPGLRLVPVTMYTVCITRTLLRHGNSLKYKSQYKIKYPTLYDYYGSINDTVNELFRVVEIIFDVEFLYLFYIHDDSYPLLLFMINTYQHSNRILNFTSYLYRVPFLVS